LTIAEEVIACYVKMSYYTRIYHKTDYNVHTCAENNMHAYVIAHFHVHESYTHKNCKQ